MASNGRPLLKEGIVFVAELLGIVLRAELFGIVLVSKHPRILNISMESQHKEKGRPPPKKPVVWTEEECHRLLQLIETHGTSWIHIAKQMIGRNPTDLRNKYNTMRRQGRIQRGQRYQNGRRAIVTRGATVFVVGAERISLLFDWW